MHVVKLRTQLKLTSANLYDQLSSEQKIIILRTLFGGSLEKVTFWDLYRTLKKLKSHYRFGEFLVTK